MISNRYASWNIFCNIIVPQFPLSVCIDCWISMRFWTLSLFCAILHSEQILLLNSCLFISALCYIRNNNGSVGTAPFSKMTAKTWHWTERFVAVTLVRFHCWGTKNEFRNYSLFGTFFLFLFKIKIEILCVRGSAKPFGGGGYWDCSCPPPPKPWYFIFILKLGWWRKPK
jgi:hypothetical protein